MNKETEKMLNSINKTLIDHIQTDNEMFNSLNKKLDTVVQHTNNMSDFNDFIKGIGLMKKPMMWFVAIIVGIVALFGGLKTILSWFIIQK